MSKILIIEDNINIRNVLKKYLKELGHEIVGEFDDIFGIVNKCQKLKPDIITLDLYLKNTDGINAIKLLKKTYPNLKIIVISVSNKKTEIFKALNYGADYFIIKPVDKEKLKKAFEKIQISQSKISKIRRLYKREEENILDVKNFNSTLTIYIKKPLNGKTIEKINKVVDGLLIIKPLKIVFSYFDENESVGKIEKSLNDIIIKIRNHGGIVEIEK
ncbi:response regulator [Marinitoga sp. 1155]|uniref:response regulator n=1 Tax=Marinitoga sp. 1155 TaxID=1428448 RepID=UPI000659190E|nr:response regulator [Marinitoga sp. 1155]KLO23617.1 hypothetical protein X274_06040 [Marinitoga sp. 1155]